MPTADIGNNILSLNEEEQFLSLPLNPEINSLVNGAEESLLDYLTITEANTRQPVRITLPEIIKGGIFAITSYTIGGVAAWAYIGPSKNAAKGNPVTAILNASGALVLNTLVSGYFFNAVVSETFDNIINPHPKESRDSLNRLQNLNSKLSARFLRGIKGTGAFFIILVPAFLLSWQYYFLDKSESNDPEPLPTIILLSNTMLQYKSVEAIIYSALPTLAKPFYALRRRFNKDAEREHKVRTALGKLKAGHREALSRAHTEFLRATQTHDDATLETMYELLNQPHTDLMNSAQLLFAICTLAKENEYEPSNKGRITLQILSLLITTASLPGYFLKTTLEASRFLSIDDPVKKWSLGSLIFLTSFALSYDVAWEMFGNLYDFGASFIHGIKQNWQNSRNWKDFLSAGWNAKFNLSSWQTLIRFPLAIQQNPKTLLTALGLLWALSYWSCATSTYLNEEMLGLIISLYLEVPTDIAVMFFNAYPVDKILGSLQHFATRLWGSEKNKQEIKLEYWIQNQIKYIDSIDDNQFLKVLNDIATHKNLDPVQKENLFTVFFGNKKISDLFGQKHPYVNREYQEIISSLAAGEPDNISLLKKATNQLSTLAGKVGIFKQEPLLSKQKSYYTLRNFSSPAALGGRK